MTPHCPYCYSTDIAPYPPFPFLYKCNECWRLFKTPLYSLSAEEQQPEA